jgi:hypothetical protein
VTMDDSKGHATFKTVETLALKNFRCKEWSAQ